MIGPVDSECAQALRRARRKVSLPDSVDDASIFFNLSMDRVHYLPHRNALYFVDSGHIAVAGIIQSVLQGMGRPLRVEQLYLDRLGIFKSLKRVEITSREAASILVALRLGGVRISVSG